MRYVGDRSAREKRGVEERWGLTGEFDAIKPSDGCFVAALYSEEDAVVWSCLRFGREAAHFEEHVESV